MASSERPKPGETWIIEVPAGGPDRQIIEVTVDRIAGTWLDGHDANGPRQIFLPLAKPIERIEHG